MNIKTLIIGERKYTSSHRAPLSLPEKGTTFTVEEPRAHHFEKNDLFVFEAGDIVVAPALYGKEQFVVGRMGLKVCSVINEQSQELHLQYRYICPPGKEKELENKIGINRPKKGETWYRHNCERSVQIVFVGRSYITWKGYNDASLTGTMKTDLFVKNYKKIKRLC